MGNPTRSNRLQRFGCLVFAGLTLVACTASDDIDPTTGPPPSTLSAELTVLSSTPAVTSKDPVGGVVSAYGTEPVNPLVPSNTNEPGGAGVIDLLFAGLVHYAADGSVVNEMAESIESADGQNYDVKLKTGWKFSNGENVTAQSFIDAWNFAALSTNHQVNAPWFAGIEGYADVSSCEPGQGTVDSDGNPTCLPSPKAQTLSGLSLISDSEFTVRLSSPQSDFPLSLGAPAFLPMAKAALADIATAGQNPISNGPYQLAAWEHGTQIELIPNPEYQGPRKAQNGGVTFWLNLTQESAYSSVVANQLDVTNTIPAATRNQFQSALGERAVIQPSAQLVTLTIPESLPHLGPGEEGNLRRAALSMLIDRRTICAAIYANTKAPATDFLAPTIPGFNAGPVDSQVLTFDPKRAAELWTQANAISQWDGQFTISYVDVGSEAVWVRQLIDQLKGTLLIQAEPQAWPDNPSFLDAMGNNTIGTAFESAWAPDYPSSVNFLRALYYTGGSSNTGHYANPSFDALIDQGITGGTADQGVQKSQEAEQVLLQDLPAIPLWHNKAIGAHSSLVSSVHFDWNGVPSYDAITKLG